MAGNQLIVNQNKIKITLVLMLFFGSIFSVLAQNSSQNHKLKISDVSRPEIIWALKHPFKAFKARKISAYCLNLTDSIRNIPSLDGDANGGQVDAFRHTVWMALLTREINEKTARSLGNAHEKGNYLHFKKGITEDGTLPDKVSSDMDFYNNEIGIGIAITKDNKSLTDSAVINLIIQFIIQGKLKIISKNSTGEFLDCSGKPIPEGEILGKWETRKCLLWSDYSEIQ